MGCRNTKGVEYCDEELINEQYPYRRAYLGSHRTVGIRSDNRYSDITLVILLCVTIKKCENKFIVKLPPLQDSSILSRPALLPPHRLNSIQPPNHQRTPQWIPIIRVSHPLISAPTRAPDLHTHIPTMHVPATIPRAPVLRIGITIAHTTAHTTAPNPPSLLRLYR
jgi:hypothetical protein